jgi:TolB-like protein/Tfp pilus assembly protein PilF
MLIGQPPFTGPTSQVVIARHSVEPVPSLRAVRQTVPPAVEQAITRALAKVPADRFPSMQRFQEALESSAVSPASTTTPGSSWSRSTPPARRRAMTALAAVGLAVAAAAVWWLVAAPPRSTAVAAVAVLPFQDLAGDSTGSYLGDGMTEGLIADLAEIGSLKVISRESGALAQGASRSLAELASELGVDAVVTGSVRRAGDMVRVSVRFLHAPDSLLLLAKDYERGLGGLPDLQREIALAIGGSIQAKLRGSEQSRLSARREIDQRAYEAYLRGRFHLERGEVDQALAMFEQASRIAPAWAPPYVGLANYYTSLPFFTDVSPADVLPKARAALARALELDESLAEAHAANAYIRAYYEWDWRAAEQEFRRALELRPNYADAYFSYGRFLASRHRLDEAIAQLDRAVELDPLSASLLANRALLDYFAGRYARADSGLRGALARDSADVVVKWGQALVAEQQGKSAQAIAILEPISAGSLNRTSSLGYAYGVAGKRAQARGVLDSLRAAAAHRYVPAYYFALLHASMGERDQALRYLERAYEERSTVLAYLLIDPRLASLRDEPRFLALARRLAGE